MNALQMLFGSVLLLALAWIREPFPTVQIWQAGFIPLIYLTFAGSIGGTSTFYWLVSKMGPIIPSTWSYFSPVIALTAGSLMLKEIFTVRQLIGAVLIVVFVAIAQFWPRIIHAIRSHSSLD
jgi:drug/metabolite transporter (DMT)-like permease